MQNRNQVLIGSFFVLLGGAWLAASLLRISFWAVCFPLGLILLGVLFLVGRPPLFGPTSEGGVHFAGDIIRSGEWSVKNEEFWLFCRQCAAGYDPRAVPARRDDDARQRLRRRYGFPCQPFSIAGVSKKKSLGRAHGFLDETQGTLFFDIARILNHQRPKALLLENVKNLISHDGGRTFQVISRTLRDELGYRIEWRIVDARHFVPQHRERLMIVGFREETGFTWGDLRLPPLDRNAPVMRDILHPENGSETPEDPFTVGEKAKVNEKYILSNKLWGYLKEYAERHKAKGNGFGFGLVGSRDIARTLSARYYKDGSEILINRGRFVGDFFLIFAALPGVSPDHTFVKLGGMVGFLGGYLCLLAAYWRHVRWGRQELKALLPVLVALVPVAIVLLPHLHGVMRAWALIFTGLLSLMAWSALCTVHRGYYARPIAVRFAAAGYLMFLSDLAVGMSFFYPGLHRNLPWLGTLIWITYVPAWALIVVNLSESRLRTDE